MLANLTRTFIIRQEFTTTVTFFSIMTNPALTTTITATITSMAAAATTIAIANTRNAGLTVYLHAHLSYVVTIISSAGAAILGSFGIVFATPGT
jgi:hypothetical protein